MRCLVKYCGSVLAVGGLLAVSGAMAQDTAGVATPTEKSSTTHAQSNQTRFPSCLESLDLSAEQRSQIEEVVRDNDADIAAVWKQFSDRYMESVRTEALLLCAIEDNLTEAQRTQVREQRRRVAQREKSHAAKEKSQVGTKPLREGTEKPLKGTKGDITEATDKPESAVDEQLAIVGVSLTPEQESAADRIQEQYLSHLRTLNRGVDGFHTRLVSLEADKFVEIEKILTKEQLKQLREIRQSAPIATADQATRKISAKRTN